jgi:hypothetical protein
MSARPYQRRGPSGPLAFKGGLGLIQVGYDQPFKIDEILPVAVPFTATIPRNPALDPLQVVLPDVTPGNILEVDFNLNLLDGTINPANFAALAIVSFKDAPVFPTDFFVIDNSGAFMEFQGNEFQLMRSLVSVVIPDGATKATVQIAYNDQNTGAFIISGTDAPGILPGSTLKASEYDALSVPQPGPSVLLPL